MSSAPPPPPYNEKAYNNYQGAPPGMSVPQPMYVPQPMLMLSDYPMQCVCPRCNQSIVTRTEKQNGVLTWLLVGGLILIGCWLGCCFIPLCVDGCKDTAHYCPSCSHPFGVKKQL